MHPFFIALVNYSGYNPESQLKKNYRKSYLSAYETNCERSILLPGYLIRLALQLLRQEED